MQAARFLWMHLRRFFRECQSIGIVYSLILFTAIGAGFYLFYRLESTGAYNKYSFLFLLIIITIIHFVRSDHRFIAVVSVSPHIIYWLQYFTLVTPFVLIGIFTSGNFSLLLLYPASFVLSYLRVTPFKSSFRLFTDRLVPENNYEWKAGMRRTGFILIVLWMLAAFVSWLPYVTLVVLWFFLLTVSSFYDEGESREMVESYQKDPVSFLTIKLRQQLLMYVITVIPVLTLTLIFWPDRWWIFLLFGFFGGLNMAVFVLSKYAVWRPSETNRSNSVINAFCMMGFFLPFLLPLPLVALIRNYRKAIRNLQPLLHDYHY